MAKTVAQRAAELGTDQATLVRALKALSTWRTISGPRKRNRDYGYWSTYRRSTYRPKRALMGVEQAAAMLGVSVASAQQAIKESHPRTWTQDEVLSAVFAFIKKHNRWPLSRDCKSSNGMPPYRQYAWLAQRHQWNISPRDWWERQVAKDKRCTPQMAVTLRNVLARKEAIERIGFQTFIKKKMAEVIAEDVEFGTLYRLPGETPSEPMVLLKVVNSTPNEQGRFDDYYLRVPPSMTDVREALKWTFNGNEALGSQPYAPLVET